MTYRLQRVLVVGSAVLLMGTLLLLYAIRADFSHSYAHFTGQGELALPALTDGFAIPVLGGDAARGKGQAVFYLVWSGLFLLPLGGLAWSISAKDRHDVAVRWFLFNALYLPLVASFLFAFVYGLWLPFGLM